MAIEDYVEHMPPIVPTYDAHAMSRYFLAKCPVVHSDEDGGFWVINRHPDVLRVCQDSETFANGNRGVRVPHDPPGLERPPMVPIDSNPPLHRDVRRVLNPFLTPQALEPHEEEFRAIIGGLIEAFAGDGQCDIATQLAKQFPADITSRYLFGVTDPDELHLLRHWVRKLSYDMHREDPKVLIEVQDQWSAWSHALVQRRRAEPRDDIVSALLTATVEDGRWLTDEEVDGAIQILTLGGFSTTSDATSNIVIRLIEEPGLESYLREHPEMISAAIEEALRLEPPVDTRPRRCTRDVEIGGKILQRDDRLLLNYLAANVDPEEWDQPDEFRLDRPRSRVMTFGAGPHRCVGSNLARTTLRIMVEELLKRVSDIRWADDRHEQRVAFGGGAWRAVDSLPIRFTPRRPRRAA
jgi:cytochrome P450